MFYSSADDDFCEDVAIKYVQFCVETRIATGKNTLKWLEGTNSMLNAKYRRASLTKGLPHKTITEDWARQVGWSGVDTADESLTCWD